MKGRWLTPENNPVETIPITLNIPDDNQWLSCLKGAILLLCKEDNWELFGDVSPEDVSRRWQEIFFEVWP